MPVTPALRHSLVVALMLTGISCTGAQACSPSREYINRPLAMKLSADGFFIGKISAVDDKHVTFTIITPGGAAKEKKAGETLTLDLKDNGTCGNLPLREGETWIYNGSNISFSPSQKLDPSDLRDGEGLENVKRNLVSRLDPDYKPPRAPAKQDLPVPGTYMHSESCGDEGGAATYTLVISPPDAAKNYKVDIRHTSCGGDTCTFTGSAPAYGFGEVVIHADPEPRPVCSIIVQQLSPLDEWPPLKDGEARVRLNDSHGCRPFLVNCDSAVGIDSPVLQKQDKAERAE